MRMPLFMLIWGAMGVWPSMQARESTVAYRPLQATYSIYAGEVPERKPPTDSDRKLAIAIDGKSAKDIFESIGPDVHPTCSEQAGNRDRRKGNLMCTYNAHGPAQGYRCWIGVNLKTGTSIPAITC
ncbi:hypothetical protein [Pseudoduganella lurida]|uniref:hypothetical protein n=1 Tax=Pseudoduganella lurida TaxID=1036180 RepID=UPI001E5DBC42|nr:hypothetical protein [Pseudoduganella lurida]